MNLRKAAKGKCCDLRIPGICNRDPTTTVLAHITTEYKGIALKSPDICAVRACSDCHDYFDGRAGLIGKTEYQELALAGLCRTLKAYINEGLIELEGIKHERKR